MKDDGQPPLAPFAPRRRLLAITNYRPGAMAFNTLLGSFWQGVRLISQALTVVILARSMGASGYGMLAAFGGLAIILGGLSGLGTGYYLLQMVSAQPDAFGSLWRTCVVTVGASGIGLVAIYVVIAPWILGVDLTIFALLLLAVSELIFFPIIYASAFAFQAHERLGWATFLPSIASVMRLTGAGAFVMADVQSDFATYVSFHTAATFAAAAGAFSAVQLILRPPLIRAVYKRAIPAGIGYSTAWLTSNAYGEVDKVLVARFLEMTTAGLYAVAYRFVFALIAPVATLALAVQPRMYRHHAYQRHPDNRRLLYSTLGAATSYAVVASLAVQLIAPSLLPLLGEVFEDAAPAIRWLAPLLILISLRLVLATHLSSTGLLQRRTRIELTSTLVLLIACVLLIPSYGLWGAIASLYVSETLQLILALFASRRAVSNR